MKRVFLILPLLLILVFLSGCQGNKYEEYYSAILDKSDYISTDEAAKLIEVADASQISVFESNDDYVLIGTSAFKDLWVPRIYSIECAKKYGASLVLVSYQKGETKEGQVIMNVPTSQTTYHHGTVYGRHGRHVSFSGSSTTYGSTPVAINYQNTYYQQQAYFFGKRKNKNSFGVYFQLPENIPGNTDTRVRIAIVASGSLAEKQNIKVGDFVKTVNGKSIKTADDIRPFIEGTEKIEKIEVTNE